MTIRILFLAVFVSGSAAWAALPPLEKFGFDPDSPVHSRVRTAPDFAVRHINTAIYRNGSCVPYEPSPREHDMIRRELESLPPLCRRALRERVPGIYFLDGMNARGIVDTVTNREGRPYWILYLNRKTLSESGSELLTRKFLTAFRATGDGHGLSVDCGRRMTGLSYILLHESAHIADFAFRISPPSASALSKNPGRYPIASAVWTDFNRPRPEFDFPERSRLAFYGRQRGEKPPLSEAPLLLSRLENSPFVSPYACLNWHEDLAELFAFFVLTEKQGHPYSITITSNGRAVFRTRPMKSPAVHARTALLERFFESGR